MRRALIGGLWMVAAIALATDYRSLLNEERTTEWASHVVTIRAADLTNTVAGSTQVINAVTLAANEGLQLWAMKLITPFADTNLPNVNTSLWLTAGNTATTNIYLGQTSVALSNAPVYLVYGTTNQIVYTTADFFKVKLWGTSTNWLSQMDVGEARFYLRKIAVP